jgi:ABC-2 type transport system permease protein
VFLKIYTFEIRYWLKQPVLYVFLALNALLVFGAVSSDNVTIGQSFDNLNKNAPFVVQSLYAYMSGITFLLVTAFVQASALRDVNHRTQELVFTTPLQKVPYLMGRFFGACTVALVPFLGVTLGILLGGMAPWLDAERVGAVYWNAHLFGFVGFGVTNTLIVGALVFAVAAVTRSTAATFVGAIGIIVAYSIAATLLGDLENERLGVLIDTFGIGTLGTLTKYWTVSERNSQVLGVGGDFLLNRIVWLSVAAVLAAGAVKAFRFTVEGPRRWWRRRPVAEPSDPDLQPHLQIHAPLPQTGLSFSGRTHFRQLWSQARVDFRGIVRSVPFLIILVMATVNVGGALWQTTEFFGLTAYPVTYRTIGVMRGTMYLFTIILLTLYTGELVWKERMARMDEIHDAMPHPIWVSALGKLLAILGVLVLLQSLMVLAGVTAQALRGYFNFELGVYLKELLVLDLVAFAFLAVLSLLIHVLVNNRFLGYFVFVTALVVNTFIWGPLKVQSVMLRYGSAPGYVYSDMNGFGPYVSGLFWFNLYWAAFAGLLMVAVALFWLRGRDLNAAARRLNARLRFYGGARAATAALAVAWLLLTGFVYYNTQMVNEYTPIRTAQDRQVQYELRYKEAYEGQPQPRVTDIRYEIDVYPYERDLQARGEFVLVNQASGPIDTLFVNLDDDLAMSVSFSRGELAREDEELGVQFYHLDPALQPGDTLTASFSAEYVTEGFENQVRVTQVVPNGTFFNNGLITPTLGYQAGREMLDRNERRKKDLPERARMPDLQRECAEACMNHYISNFSDWVTMETVMSTSPDQIAVAPGSLVEEWEEGGRRYFRYVLDHPSLGFNSFISADYEVLREKWGDVDVEVYYHAGHPYNVDKMANSIRKSLAYNEENFGPYRHRQARIIEFPRYASFAQAFPGTMPYSEAIGFIADIEDEDEDIDMVFYVTAHEMAHQWWAHQVIGAQMEGATVLSETLAQYSAIMVMEKEYGQDRIHKFLRYEMDNYLRSRGAETLEEKPLMRVDASQGYVHYRKGSVVLYYLKEMIGEERLNSALRDLVETYAYAEPPYPTSHALVDRLRSVTPDSLQYLITDLFEEITLFDNRVVGDPAWETTEDGRYRVTFDVTTAKIRADSVGAEQEIPMDDYVDLGVFARPEDDADRGATLHLERRRLTDGEHTIEIVVDEEPWEVGIDPNFYLIDRIPDDNLKRARERSS